MANRLQTYVQPTLTTFTGGQRSLSRILGGKRNAWYTFVIEGTVTVAGGAVTQDMNGGNLASLFQFVGVDENGYDAAVIDARQARFLSALTSAGLPADITLPSLAANGAYALRTTIRLPFAWILGMHPYETAHVERDPSQNTFTFVQPWAGAISGGVIDGNGFIGVGPGTLVVTGLTVRCYQHFDDLAAENMPIFVPRYRSQEFTIAGANANEPIYIRSAVPLRGLLVQQDTTGSGEVSDIINGLAHRDSLREYVGPQKANFGDLTRMLPLEYGGNVMPGGTPIAAAVYGNGSGIGADWFQNYQALGKLSNIWNPATGGQDLRWELDVQPSVTGTPGTSVVRTNVMELLKIANRTRNASFGY